MTAKKDRRSRRSLTDAVEMLDSVQNFALGSLLSHGAELDFIRNTDDGPLAVCHANGSLITIDRNGVVDEHPDIRLRNPY